MSHDEITTKLELPKRRASDNIVRVNFSQNSPSRKENKAASPATAAPIPEIKRSSLFPRLKDIDFTAPWVIRLVAVVTVLILSMLIL